MKGASMKKAYFIIGAESSGTRVLTQAFIKAGCFGDAGHFQKLDSLNLNNRPDNIVFRRSLPHAGIWSNVRNLKKLFEDADYEVEVIGITRIPRYTVLSQLTNHQHARTQHEAEKNIKRAVNVIVRDADTIIKYEQFVTDGWFRKQFFEERGLEEPHMHFFNANEKYMYQLEEDIEDIMA
jgi:LPS sulfotransferase NodH